uniref:GIY-YIG domain-containing protein n=1 Tax=Solanum lycopersicum TaxID=4081 RepID=A0A3Q7EJE3_SOLLC
MARPLSTIFKSTKPHILKPPKPSNFESNLKVPSSSSCSTSRKSDANSQQSYPELLTSPASNSTEFSNSKKKKSLWCVYLILSTNPPIKTYVGVTTNFCRRLKEHNGELKGGAKASRSGRPWICACLIRGFKGRSEGIEPYSSQCCWQFSQYNWLCLSGGSTVCQVAEFVDKSSVCFLLWHSTGVLAENIYTSEARSLLFWNIPQIDHLAPPYA